jgi:hypothetical protein
MRKEAPWIMSPDDSGRTSEFTYLRVSDTFQGFQRRPTLDMLLGMGRDMLPGPLLTTFDGIVPCA